VTRTACARVLLLLLAACTGRATTPAASGPHPVYSLVQADEDIDGVPAARYFTPGEPTIFVVFASWCVHCRRELAVLTQLRAAHPRVHVIGLNAYEEWDQASDETQLRAYLAQNAPWLPVVRSDDAMLSGLGGVPKIPSLFVFDGRGALVQTWKRNERAVPTREELEATLAPLL